MDQDRQIRFAIPPFFLIGSLAFGLSLSANEFQTWIAGAEAEQLLVVGAAIAASILPVGFVISATTFLMLPICFVFSKYNFAAPLSQSSLDAIWPLLNSSKECSDRYVFEAVTTFDHELLSPGIHSWIVRVWNAFLISAQSIVALGMAHIVALALSVEQPKEWWIPSVALITMLLANAGVTWLRMKDMLDFQASRKHAEINIEPVGDSANELQNANIVGVSEQTD